MNVRHWTCHYERTPMTEPLDNPAAPDADLDAPVPVPDVDDDQDDDPPAPPAGHNDDADSLEFDDLPNHDDDDDLDDEEGRVDADPADPDGTDVPPADHVGIME